MVGEGGECLYGVGGLFGGGAVVRFMRGVGRGWVGGVGGGGGVAGLLCGGWWVLGWGVVGVLGWGGGWCGWGRSWGGWGVGGFRCCWWGVGVGVEGVGGRGGGLF